MNHERCKQLFFLLFFSLTSLDARLYFLHIPKTGGTSLRLMLEQQLSFAEICPFRNRLDITGPISYELVSGHFPYWLCKKLDPEFEKAFKVTILRDPIERYLSFLRAKKRSDGFSDLESVFKLSQSSDQRFKVGLIDNALCRNLSSNPILEGKALLESAKKNLEKIDWVLFFDYFEEDVIDLFQHLGITIEAKEIPKINTTIKEAVSDELLDKIRQIHLLDIELYKYAKTSLKRKKAQYQLRTDSFNSLLQTVSCVDYHFGLPLNGKGWSYREYEQGSTDLVYRWVMEGPATLYFHLEEDCDYDFYFTAHLLTEEVVPQVDVNGSPISLVKLDDQYFSKYYGKIPRDLIQSSVTEFIFYSNKSFPCRPLHPSRNNRHYPNLSFAVSQVIIRS